MLATPPKRCLPVRVLAAAAAAAAAVPALVPGCADDAAGGAGGDGGEPGPRPARIEAFEPAAASFRGGDVVRILGAHLAPARSVRFGDDAAEVLAAAPDALTVRAPRRAAGGGLVTVTVTTDRGEAAGEGFRYLGVPPPSLRWVELPARWAAASAAPAGPGILLRRGAGAEGGPPRVAIAGPDGVALYDVGADGSLAPAGAVAPGTSGAAASCAADFDGDGDDDLWLVDGAGGGGLFVHHAGGVAAPVASAALRAIHGACGDVDGVGGPDVVAVVAPEGEVPALRTLLGRGEHLDLAATGVSLGGPVTSLAVADVDGDGDGDALVGRAGLPPRLLLGDGFGGFADAPAGSLPRGGEDAAVLLADLTGDGAPDALLLSPAAAALWVGDGTGRLADHTGLALGVGTAPGARLTAADVDVDGAVDVLAVGGGGLRVFRNDGGGRLFDYTTSVLARPGRGPASWVAAGDFDGDDDSDLLVGRAPGTALLKGWDPEPFEDPDGDRAPSQLDVCPAVPDPEQANADATPFGCGDASACEQGAACVLATSPAGRAYLSCPAAAVSQAAARQACAALGAELLFLDDLGEQGFVAGLAPGRFWMDLSDAASEGLWVSASGRAAPYTEWAPGQPDDAGGAEDCVELRVPGAPEERTIWNDLPCEGHPVGYVCEDDPPEAEPDPGDACDVCPWVYDPGQADADADGVGDACGPPAP